MSQPDLGPLARIAQDVAADWSLELGPPFALSRYSYVAPVGDDAVLKVTPPEDDESDEVPTHSRYGTATEPYACCGAIMDGARC